MIPHASASISNPGDYYNVSSAIPTSEQLTAHAEAKNSLYTVVVRNQEWTGCYKDVTISGTANYTWQKEVSRLVNYFDSGEGIWKSKTVTDWETQYGSVSDKKEHCSYGPVSYGTFYDVPVSSIYPLTGGSASAVHNEGQSVGNVSVGPGAGGPGADHIGLNYNFVVIKDCEATVSQTTGDRYESQQDVEARALDKLRNAISAKENELKAKINGCSVTVSDPVNYNFGGLSVTSTSSNDKKPVVGNATNDTPPTPIDSSYPNGTYKGQGSASWSNGISCGMVPNNVVVHTPVVNYVTKDNIEVQRFINQKINKDESTKKYIQLDKIFRITIPDEGEHITDQGYGNRRYNTRGLKYRSDGGEKTNWGAKKDFKFPFDVYVLYNVTFNGETTDLNKISSYETYLLKAEKWLSEADISSTTIDLSNNSQIFLLPVWALETDGEISTRVLAENAVSEAKISRSQLEANKDRGEDDNYKYSATKNIAVEIIGKIYDLQVHESVDVDWNGKIQGSKTNNNYVTASEFPFGNTYIGSGIKSQNSNPAYKYAPKLGYTFSFNFKTKGRKSNEIQIDITKFSFVSKDGGGAQEVDLWYKPTGYTTYLKIDGNVGNLKVTPNDDYLRIPPIEKQDSQKVYPIEKKMSMYSRWIGNVPYNYSNKVSIGTFKQMVLPHTLRFVFDNFDEYVIGKGNLYKKNKDSISNDAAIAGVENGDDRVLGSVGRWYTGYTLPQTTVAVPKNIDPNNKPGEILKNGYILVSFGIKSRDNGNEYLLYHGPETDFDQGKAKPNWIENDPNPIKLPTTKDADVPPDSIALYESDYSAQMDRVPGMDF